MVDQLSFNERVESEFLTTNCLKAHLSNLTNFRECSVVIGMHRARSTLAHNQLTPSASYSAIGYARWDCPKSKYDAVNQASERPLRVT